MRALAAVFATAIVTMAASAGANPMVVNWSVAVQVPGSPHVQVSYLAMDGSGWPTGLTRNGKVLEPVWQGPVTVSHNGGSGVMSYSAMQVCDCYVGPGSYDYVFTGAADWGNTASVYVAPVVGEDPGMPADVPMSDLVVVVDAGTSLPDIAPVPPAPTDALDEDVPSIQDALTEEVFPWDEPEPDWPQGADCRAICEGTGPWPDDGGEVWYADVPYAELPATDLAAADPGQVDAGTASDSGGATQDAIAGTETGASADAAIGADVPTGTDNAINPIKDDGGTGCAAGNPASFAGLWLILAAAFLALRRARSHA